MTVIEFIFNISFWLIIYSYALYPAFLLLWDTLEGPRQRFKTSEELPGVSIIIAAYNEEKVIKTRIENCLAIDYPLDKIEIIIASDGSSDKTSEIALSYAPKGIRTFDYKDRQGKVNVLNQTVPQSKYPIIIFSDANTLFKRDAIKKLVRHFGDDRIGCVVGGLEFVNAQGSSTGELEGIYWRYETMLKKLEGRRGCLLGANGGIFAIRKELFIQLPSDTIVEDFVLPMKILEKGFAVIYEPNAHAVEEAAHKIIQEKQRRIRIGAGDFQALFRLSALLNPFRGFVALAFWSHKVLRWFTPFFMMIAFTLNFFLINHPKYLLLFTSQCLFYGCALTGQYLSHIGKKNRILNLCYYFVSMNLALFLGFVRFISKTQSVKWKRTER